jgi:aldehyde:ferredoxin oxidoreductase
MQPILNVNLSTRESSDFIIPAEWERDYLGGASLGARLLYSTLLKDLDPYGPEAPLLFLNGPLSGTAGPTVGRFVVCGKSPATNLWAESNCGGFWGPELRFCGYDGLWITGKAKEPIFLWLQDNLLEFRDANAVWGKDTYESQSIIKTELSISGTHVLTIGPAGENGIKFAGLYCDHGRSAGRTGLGAVAGAKNLKAIALKGTKKIPLAQPEIFGPIRSASNHFLKDDTVTQVVHELGTAGVADYADYLGGTPKKYFHQGVFEGVDKVSGSAMAETILVGVSACHACVVACGRVVRLEDGQKRKGPEYETLIGFGPNLLNDDMPLIVRLGEICDREGMDTISASNVIGLAYHLFQKGVISENDIGFPLNWGDMSGVSRLLQLTARREGIGNIMAEGSRQFGAHFGAEDEAVQVNGLEVPYHDPRGVSGMALVYATSPRGACHNKSDYFLVDWGQADTSLGLQFFERHAGAEKAANVAHHQNWRSLCDALVLCLFGNVPAEMVAGLVNAACGYDYKVNDLLRIGERAWTLKRAINIRLGLTRENDTLPKALLEPLLDGPAAGYVPPIEEMLTAYYNSRGWDSESGKPTPSKLSELGMEWIINDIWNR